MNDKLTGPWDGLKLDDRVLVMPDNVRGTIRGFGPWTDGDVLVRVDDTDPRDLSRVWRFRLTVVGRAAHFTAREVEAFNE